MELAVLAAVILLSTSARAAPLAGANANVDRLCTLDGVGTTDKTSAANDATANDVSLGATGSGLPTDVNAVYIGLDAAFDELTFNVGTAGTVGVIDWDYGKPGIWSDLAVTDETNNFRNGGTNTVRFTPPADWVPRTLADCSGTAYYYVRISTHTAFTVVPLATQISAQVYNLRIHVQHELGDALAGLPANTFSLSDGTDNTVYAVRDRGSGDYELALAAESADTNYGIRASADRYAPSPKVATGTLTSSLKDLTGTPLSLPFAYKVSGITTEAGGAALTGATVKAGNGFATTCTSSGSAWYCPVPVSDSETKLQVSKDGYVTQTPEIQTDRAWNDDPQGVYTVADVQYTLKLTVSGTTSLAGVVWEKSIDGGAYTSVTPAATSGTSAFFAQSPGEARVVYRASRSGLSATSGLALTTTAIGQMERTLALAPGAGPSAQASSSHMPTSSSARSPSLTLASARASAPKETGPIIPVSWTSMDAGAGVARVQIWVLEPGHAPKLHHESTMPGGTVAFYGVSGHTYAFFARAYDENGDGYERMYTEDQADATTRVTTDRIVMDAACLSLVGPVPGAPQAIDKDGDGFPETFEEASQTLELRRVVGRASLEPAMLVRSPATGSLFLWNLLANCLDRVESETLEGLVPGATGGEFVLKLGHESASGWTLADAPDASPESKIARVVRADGTEVSPDRVWREGGRAFVLDNEAVEYHVVYAKSSRLPWTPILVGFGGLVGAITAGFVTWLEWPSVARIERSTGAEWRLRWTARHCLRCRHPLPRLHRIFRTRHKCAASPDPAVADATAGAR